MLCARVSLWIKTYLQMSDWFFSTAILPAIRPFYISGFSKKSVMRVILVLVNWSFWLISEGDRQWFSAANNVVRTIYAEWFIPYTPEIQIYYPAFFYLCEYRAASTNVPERDMRGLCFFGVWLFFLMCLCYSFHYSPYYWNTLSVYKRASVIR